MLSLAVIRYFSVSSMAVLDTSTSTGVYLRMGLSKDIDYPSMQEAGSNMKFTENRGPLHQNSSEFLKTESITQLNVVVALEMINTIKLCKDLSFM